MFYLRDTYRDVDEKTILIDLPEHLRKEALIFLEGETIKRAPIFRDMSNAFVRSIAMVLEPAVYSPGNFLYRRGQIQRNTHFVSTNVQCFA